jgi:hypothetical protein
MKISKKQKEAIDSIREKQLKLRNEIGGLYIELAQVQSDLNVKIKDLDSTSPELQAVMREIVDKHGHGSLNLETGEYTLVSDANETN